MVLLYRRPVAAYPLSRLAHLDFHLSLLLLALALLQLPTSSVAQTQPPSPSIVYLDLLNDQPVIGTLPANATAYYRFAATPVAYTPTTLFAVSATSGLPTLYASLSNATAPSAAHFDYAASYTTGGVVSIDAQPTPYTAYLAVQASPYSSCNYTLVATSYDPAAQQTTPIPLPDAEPLASSIAAGEYRYYTYDVPAGSSAQQVTVSLTETYGQSYLYINSPNTTALPTVQSSQYPSSSATFPLVVLPSPVAAGTWTIAVWSNASSAFTIIAVTDADTRPMQLGVTYPGYVAAGSYVYYSVYLDALLLSTSTSLSIDLYSISGDADLYCSNVTSRPTNSEYSWSSASSEPADHITIPAAQLQAGLTYCGVSGYFTSPYTIVASLGGAVALTSGEVVVGDSPAGGTQQYTFTFPAVAASTVLTLSLTAEFGAATLQVSYAGAAGYVQSNPAAPSQLAQLYASTICGLNNRYAIPGSQPPLCQMTITVSSPVITTYRIVASVGSQVVALTAGEPLEWATSANQTSAYFSFTVPDSLSNVSVLVSMLDGASGAMLSVGKKDSSRFTAVCSATQQLGSDVMVCQFDWTSPGLPSSQSVKGDYVLQVTSPSGPAAFSVLYTVQNASALGGSIVQLADGVPQAGVVGANGFMFYYFQPSVEGWPYAVTFDVEWTSGGGRLRYAWASGPAAGPTDGAASYYDSGAFTTDVDDIKACALSANATTSCGYRISVQGAASLTSPATFSITASSGQFVRTLYPETKAAQSRPLQPSASDYWVTSTLAYNSETGARHMYGLTVNEGTVTIYASTASAAPNASTAQQTLSSLSSTAVLAVPTPLPVGQSYGHVASYLTVQCVSADSTPCQYAIRAQRYVDPTHVDSSRYFAQSTSVLLPRGGVAVAYTYAIVEAAASYAYVNVQADARVGSVALYASCLPRALPSLQPLNDTTAMWRAVTPPVSIEITNLTASANCSFFIITLQASSEQDTWVELNLYTAGAEQPLLYGQAYGLSTPAYPTSYYTLDQRAIFFSLFFTLTNASSACSTSQLQLTLSDTHPHPDPSDPSTYNFTRTAVTQANGVVDLSIALTHYSRPAGSLHTGMYYVAAQAVAGTTAWCDYQITQDNRPPRTLTYGQLSQTYATASLATGYTYWTIDLPLSTAASIALQLTGGTGRLLLYVGVNTSPSPDDASSYLLVALYDTDAVAADSTYAAQPIYLPATACTAATAGGQPCLVIIRASSSAERQSMALLPMSSAAATWLYEQQSATATNLSSLAAAYQFALPAAPLSVTIAVNASSPVSIACSYRYVTPSAAWHDWQTATANMSAATAIPSVTSLTFTWDASLVTNAATAIARPATTVYCAVQATSFDAYTIAYSTTPLPDTSHSSRAGLSRGALAAAVVVPIVAVLALAGVLVWMCGGRSACCLGVAEKVRRRGSDAGRPSPQRLGEADDAREVSMAELSMAGRAGSGGGQLMGGGWRSDSV